MKITDQTYSPLSLARLLLQKGITFCLYRFPHEVDLYIALEKDIIINNEILKKKQGIDFVIAPFINNNESEKIILQKLPQHLVNESLFKVISANGDKEISWGKLPVAIPKVGYLEKCKHYLADIKGGKLSKAILSRVIIKKKPSSFDPLHLFEVLARAYQETFVSIFYLPEMGIWVGASPELLLKKNGNMYETMALAATRPRKVHEDYTWRNKEKDEHNMVREHIEAVFFENGCSLLESEGPYTTESGQVAHLRTDYTFREGNENQLNNIISTLHPTPAIGGLPVKESLECISKYEGYNRNYYTGYLGETNGEDMARLFVNLRCMQIGQEELAIFAGGGISADSDPESEWNETEQKSLTLLEKIEETTRIHAQQNEIIK